MWHAILDAVKGTLGQVPTTGRTGRAVTTRGDAATALSPSSRPPAGYEPEQIDGSIKRYLAVCERTVRQAQTIGKRVDKALKLLTTAPASPNPMDDASQITVLYERMTKAGLNIVKATDELSRLRSFLAGGPDRREDFTVKGEVELRALVITAVKELGWRVVDGAGKAIEVEATPA